ncbi:MAG TPA: hypothetical protein VM430_02170, partial [Microbacterium sp.]|nr:hypothetical protein [Microbacterium sp.]
MRVHTSEYERSLAECRVLDTLVVRDATGHALPITRVLPHVIEFGSGAATIAFAGPRALSIGRSAREPLSVEWGMPDGTRTRVE